MGKFTKISADVFKQLQFDAGVVLKNFNPDSSADVSDDDIVCATTGGINATCTPTITDLGEDIDNVLASFKEFQQIDTWECHLSFTALDMTEATIKMALGVADVTSGEAGSTASSIKARAKLNASDFSDIWWVGDRTDGGFVAVKLKNALSTGGLNIQTTKKGKGQLTVDLQGYMSIANQTEIPMEFYVMEAE